MGICDIQGLSQWVHTQLRREDVGEGGGKEKQGKGQMRLCIEWSSCMQAMAHQQVYLPALQLCSP